MAKLINIVWIFLFAFQAFYQGLVYAYYVTNKTYIVEQLCENKDKPELKCDGKCHLRKVLAIQTEAETPENTPYLPSWEELKLPTLFCQVIDTPPFSTHPPIVATLDTKRGFAYQLSYAYDPLSDHWHPPRQA